MKLLYTLLFALLSFAAHAQAWPRNPATGKVEVKGTLPWPASAKTEAQRRALVRRWYLAKLTSLSAAQVEESTVANQANGLLTYAQLPKAVVVGYGSGDERELLGCFIQLKYSAEGMRYDLAHFDLQQAVDVETTDPTPLEQVLLNPTPAQQIALVTLRKRLASALASW
jgi:hypothetical protein